MTLLCTKDLAFVKSLVVYGQIVRPHGKPKALLSV